MQNQMRSGRYQANFGEIVPVDGGFIRTAPKFNPYQAVSASANYQYQRHMYGQQNQPPLSYAPSIIDRSDVRSIRHSERDDGAPSHRQKSPIGQ
jgi:hypothetical protein